MKKNPFLLPNKTVGSLLLAVSCLTLVSTASASLLLNGNFENVPGTGLGFQDQGLMPSDWVTVNVTPDTYSNDGSYGLPPYAGGNFTGVTAQDGIRWVAGWSSAAEVFGQTLSAALNPGQSYTLAGYLIQAKRSDLDKTGGYDVYLSSGSSYGNVLAGVNIGRLGPTTDLNTWEASSFSFLAPANAGSLGFLAFLPYDDTATPGSAYAGLDNLSLTTAVPEPSTMIAGALLLLPFGASALRMLRKSRAA